MWQWSLCFLAVSGLFLYTFFFAILWPFSFWKVQSIRHLFLLWFSFSFFLPWWPEYGINRGRQNSIIFCWFHSSWSWHRAKKRMKMEKSMDAEWILTTAVRLILSPSREEEWKRKGPGKSSSSFRHFMRKREQILGTKSVLLRSKVTESVRFFEEKSFLWQIFLSKRDKVLHWWDQCKNEAEIFVWEPWLKPLSNQC